MVMQAVLIFTITCCLVQSINNCSLIVVKRIENIYKEKVSIWKNLTARTKVFKIILQGKPAKNDRSFNFPNSLVPRQTRETQFFLDNQKAFSLETT